MIKVYFTAATSFNGELHEQYRKVVEYIKQNTVELLSGEQIVSKELLQEDKNKSKHEIFEREQHLIEEADCIVAEVTKPSLGVGSEISYALNKSKPVLALVLDPESTGIEDKLSPMIAGNPSEKLFIEFYSSESLLFSIRDFLNHVQSLKNKRGKMIVIEGGDGSGKTTQAKLLVDYLKKQKITVKYMDFPQYYPSFHGQTVAKFLRGEFGGIDNVSPYLASLAFALDRASVKEQMEDFLKTGGLIVSNRYATSNMAHQSAKFDDQKEREEFIKWVYELEYKVHKIPREDIVVYLYVPWQIGIRLTQKRGNVKYMEGKGDIHESNIEYRKKVEEMYLNLASNDKKWVKIDCVERANLLPVETIHQKVVTALQERKIV